MIPGLNSNIRHQGKIFHIQTEDSGVKYGHVISHLFLEGTILASVKTAYADLVELSEDEREPLVADLMRKAHRTMIRSLTSGAFNDKAGINDSVPAPSGAASMTDIPVLGAKAAAATPEEPDIIEETLVEPERFAASPESDPNSPAEIARKLANEAPQTSPATINVALQIKELLAAGDAPTS